MIGTSPRQIVDAPVLGAGSGGKERLRLDYLDSLRGLAAVYVVAGHSLLDGLHQGWCKPDGVAMALLDHGKLAVAIFIVLSGYCLALPVVRDGQWRVSGGFGGFMARRFWRIYPPYLAAMALSIGVWAALPAEWSARSFWVSTFEPSMSAWVVVSHVLMFHNLSNDWLYKINAPFWSVATEWQIYFAFIPLVWVIRRVGGGVAIVLAMGAALLPIVAFRRFETAAPYFLCHFAMGMTAALVAHSGQEWNRRLREQVPWMFLAALGAAGVVATLAVLHGYADRLGWKAHLLSSTVAGAAFSVWLVALARSSAVALTGDTRGFMVRWLSWGPLVRLGHFSYSLYLTHAIPVVGVGILLATLGAGVPAQVKLVIAVGGGVVGSVAFAYVFHLLAEKPFLRRRESGKPVGARRAYSDEAAAESAGSGTR